MPRLSSSRLRSPVNVTWEITEACNLRCNHCLSAGMRVPGRGELDLGQCRTFVDELAGLKVFQVNFGGGEPFLRPDFLEILRHAHSQGLTCCVSTNGMLLDDGTVDELLSIGPIYLQVSLDGVQAETNDVIRGQGTFARILAGVELLSERGYPHLSLNMVVTRVNVDEIGDFHQLARRYGAKSRLSRFRPSGAGCGAWEDYRLTRDQLQELSVFLAEHPEILTGDSFFALESAERRSMGLTTCGAAKMTCAVAPDGSVYPCAFLCDPAFCAGNVTTESLAAIWSSSVFAGFRELEAKACRTCDRFSVCHGGCPAVGWFLARSLELPDPECLRAVTPSQRSVGTGDIGCIAGVASGERVT